MRVCVVEDEELLAEAIAMGLRRAGHAVDIAGDGSLALELASYNEYDIMVLDRDLPIVHGDDVCRELQEQQYPARILMLTAAAQIEDRVEGLDFGADDYLTKPFAFKELVARVNALGRRGQLTMATELTVQDLTIDPARRLVTRSGKSIDLTPKEFGILLELAKTPDVTVSAERLLEKVWDLNSDPFTGAVRMTMTRLRGKLGEPNLIETLRGVGYRIKGSSA